MSKVHFFYNAQILKYGSDFKNIHFDQSTKKREKGKTKTYKIEKKKKRKEEESILGRNPTKSARGLAVKRNELQ